MVNHMRHTRSQTAQRRSHHALKARTTSLCKGCAHPRLPHTVCMNCGMYNDKQAIKMKPVKAEKVEKSAK